MVLPRNPRGRGAGRRVDDELHGEAEIDEEEGARGGVAGPRAEGDVGRFDVAVHVASGVNVAEDIEYPRADESDGGEGVAAVAVRQALQADVREVLAAELHRDEGLVGSRRVGPGGDHLGDAATALKILQSGELAGGHLRLALDLDRDVGGRGGFARTPTTRRAPCTPARTDPLPGACPPAPGSDCSGDRRPSASRTASLPARSRARRPRRAAGRRTRRRCAAGSNPIGRKLSETTRGRGVDDRHRANLANELRAACFNFNSELVPRQKLIRAATMAASESNPTYLILGIVTFIVAFFFIGNIVACVSPARPRLHPSRSAAALLRRRATIWKPPPAAPPDASSPDPHPPARVLAPSTGTSTRRSCVPVQTQEEARRQEDEARASQAGLRPAGGD